MFAENSICCGNIVGCRNVIYPEIGNIISVGVTFLIKKTCAISYEHFIIENTVHFEVGSIIATVIQTYSNTISITFYSYV